VKRFLLPAVLALLLAAGAVTSADAQLPRPPLTQPVTQVQPLPTPTPTPRPPTAPLAAPQAAPQPNTDSVDLFVGCNNVSLTHRPGTQMGDVATGVQPAAILESIWRYNNATARFSGYSPLRNAPNDLLTVEMRPEPVFICVRERGTFGRP
jgi:hypothetical protein